jgi:hypothetical protein
MSKKLTEKEKRALDRPYAVLNTTVIEQYETLLARHRTKDWLVMAVQADVIGNELWVIRGFKYIEHAIEASTPRLGVIGFIIARLHGTGPRGADNTLYYEEVKRHEGSPAVVLLLKRAQELIARMGTKKVGEGKILFTGDE